MFKTIRADSSHPDFISLVKELDIYLAYMDGDEHGFYDQYNKLNNLKHTVVAYNHDNAAACGAMKAFDGETMEIKRMYTLPAERGKGMAITILKELETWAVELGYHQCILETGKRQIEAVALYKKSGYTIIPNYGQYANVENSICFKKIII